MSIQFKDGKYLTAADKAKVFKAWQRFLKSDLKPVHFTKGLYSVLSLHWGFIAHYNRAGFYSARFQHPTGREQTIESMLNPSRWTFVDDNCSGNADLNQAIQDELRLHAERLLGSAREFKIKTLEARIHYAAIELAELRRGAK